MDTRSGSKVNHSVQITMDGAEGTFAGSFAGILLKKDQEIQILKEKLLVKTKDYEILKQISVKCFRNGL